MKRIAFQAVAATLLFTCVYLARATTVLYDVTNISGNTWEYTYTVNNDTLGFDVEEFAIYFDVGLYDNLVTTSTPFGWDPLVFQPDTSLPPPLADGTYDALALVTGVGVGESQGGFGVRFDYLGTGVPGEQSFDVIDPLTFQTLDSGLTQVVPIPAAFWLFGTGIAIFLGAGIARRQH